MHGRPGRDRRRGAAASTILAAIATVAALALAGCTGNDAGALPPVVVDLNEVDGTTVEVDEGGTIDLTGDDETYTEWTAEIADPDIVEFEPGRDDGSAQFNPGLTAKSVGDTEVTLENGSTGDSVTFTVTVTPPTGY